MMSEIETLPAQTQTDKAGQQAGRNDRTTAPAALQLLAASQPDIVRSVQKDDIYQQQLVEDFYEVFRSTFGAFAALQSGREIKLLALLLYHGLTTGTGMPTLGEEYCNMMQLEGTGRRPAFSRRAALVILRSLGPYLADSLMARIERQQQRLDELGQQSYMWEFQPAHHHSHVLPQEVDVRTQVYTGMPHQRLWQAVKLSYNRACTAISQACAPLWPHINPALSYVNRAHLALFYLFGVYYAIPHRLAGIRYTSISRPLQGRPSYRALGVLLVLQLAVMAGLHAYQSARAMAERKAMNSVHAQRHRSFTTKHAMLLEDAMGTGSDESGSGADDNDWATVEAGPSRMSQESTGPMAGASRRTHRSTVQPLVTMSGRPCPLCLSPRKNPTSTPCGHVFCWDCVAHWCTEKPECPLCRARVLLPQLVPIYHCGHF